MHASLLASGLVGACPPLAAAPAGASGAAPAAAEGPNGPITGRWTHAYGAYGPPSYPTGFSHFAYVNPQAPKGGTLYCSNPDRRSSFDKFNYFTLKGNAPAGLMHFMFEPLAVLGADEPLTMYGLLAEALFVAPDRSSIAFRLNPLASTPRCTGPKPRRPPPPWPGSRRAPAPGAASSATAWVTRRFG